MILGNSSVQRRVHRLIALIGAGAMTFGILSSCDERMLTIAEYVDPCGTILANCEPGDLQVQAAAVGDYCVDPACTVPGQCDGDYVPLGTLTELCP